MLKSAKYIISLLTLGILVSPAAGYGQDSGGSSSGLVK